MFLSSVLKPPQRSHLVRLGTGSWPGVFSKLLHAGSLLLRGGQRFHWTSRGGQMCRRAETVSFYSLRILEGAGWSWFLLKLPIVKQSCPSLFPLGAQHWSVGGTVTGGSPGGTEQSPSVFPGATLESVVRPGPFSPSSLTPCLIPLKSCRTFH